MGHLLTRSGLTYPEVSSKVYHDSFCQLGSSISLPWVIYFEVFYLHVVSSFSCIPVICPKLVLFLTPLQFVHVFLICPSVSCCSSHVFHLCCCYSSLLKTCKYLIHEDFMNYNWKFHDIKIKKHRSVKYFHKIPYTVSAQFSDFIN